MIVGATLCGIGAHIVKVEARLEPGVRSIVIDGLAAAAERETRVRVQAALEAARIDADARVHVRCDGNGRRLDGTALDFAIALAVADREDERSIGALGELSLSGEVRPVRGVLAAVEALRQHVAAVLVAPENAAEAALVVGVEVVVVRSLRDAIDYVRGNSTSAKFSAAPPPPRGEPAALDMRDVRGHMLPRRALEIAAAGGHNLLLVGPPGAGKTMLARRLNGILPPMTHDEALDVTRVHSAAGLNIGGGIVTSRPFRAPHHSTTPPGLVGGGAALPRPGEVSLAHHGVLFLDELPVFSRMTLEVLCEPLNSAEVLLARAAGTVRFPARCLVVASMAACPCGHHPTPRCRCTAHDRARYRARVPEGLLSLFDSPGGRRAARLASARRRASWRGVRNHRAACGGGALAPRGGPQGDRNRRAWVPNRRCRAGGASDPPARGPTRANNRRARRFATCRSGAHERGHRAVGADIRQMMTAALGCRRVSRSTTSAAAAVRYARSGTIARRRRACHAPVDAEPRRAEGPKGATRRRQSGAPAQPPARRWAARRHRELARHRRN